LVLRRISDLYLYQAGTGSEAALADDPDAVYAESGQP
jgi:hypothetical protein